MSEHVTVVILLPRIVTGARMNTHHNIIFLVAYLYGTHIVNVCRYNQKMSLAYVMLNRFFLFA